MSTETKQAILDTALLLFRQRGLAHVSTRELAEATGVSRSHLYYYFGNWAALRKAAFEHFAATELEQAREALGALPPAEALHAFLRECLPVRRDTAWTLWLDAWGEAMRDPDFAETYLRIMRMWESILTEVIERGRASGDLRCRDAARAARQLFALTNGYADDLLVRPSKSVGKLALEEVLEVANVLLHLKQ